MRYITLACLTVFCWSPINSQQAEVPDPLRPTTTSPPLFADPGMSTYRAKLEILEARGAVLRIFVAVDPELAQTAGLPRLAEEMLHRAGEHVPRMALLDVFEFLNMFSFSVESVDDGLQAIRLLVAAVGVTAVDVDQDTAAFELSAAL